RFQEAYEIFNQITQKLSEHEELLAYRTTAQELAIAKDLYLKGFYEDAVDFFDKAVKRLPREDFLLGWKMNAANAFKLKKQAMDLMDQQQYEGSKIAFTQILKINPLDA